MGRAVVIAILVSMVNMLAMTIATATVKVSVVLPIISSPAALMIVIVESAVVRHPYFLLGNITDCKTFSYNDRLIITETKLEMRLTNTLSTEGRVPAGIKFEALR